MKKKFFLMMLITVMGIVFSACGKEDGNEDAGIADSVIKENENEGNAVVDSDVTPNEDYFTWDENNYITGVTDEGNKQGTLVIPARCEGINPMVFYNSSELQYVSFEDEDDVDLAGAFAGAPSLISVKLPENLKVIGQDCFGNCDQLKEITIPRNVESIEKGAFEVCDHLVSVTFEGTSVKTIGKRSFSYCSSLTEVNIPSGVTTVEESAFEDCSSLSKILLPDSLKDIGKLAFANTNLSELHFPEKIDLTNMDSTAFGMNTYDMTVYIVKDSWCDQNQDVWNKDQLFGEIKYE